MVVISYGITKSGSTLAFELAKGVLSVAGFRQRRLCDSLVEPGHKVNFINDLSSQRIIKILAHLNSDEKIVIKTHSAPPAKEFVQLEGLIRDGQLKVHIAMRDPRDVCLSLLDAGNAARKKDRPAFSEIYSIEDAVKSVQNQLPRLRFWSSLSDVLPIWYEKAAFDQEAVIENIEKNLNLNIDSQKVQIHVNQAFTQLNKGQPSRYASEMSQEVSDYITSVLSEYFDLKESMS